MGFYFCEISEGYESEFEDQKQIEVVSFGSSHEEAGHGTDNQLYRLI